MYKAMTFTGPDAAEKTKSRDLIISDLEKRLEELQNERIQAEQRIAERSKEADT